MVCGGNFLTIVANVLIYPTSKHYLHPFNNEDREIEV